MHLIYLFLQYPTVIVRLIIKATGKRCLLLSHEEAGMAVYCEHDIHATNIRGGPVPVTHRDDAIGSSRKTVCWQKI